MTRSATFFAEYILKAFDAYHETFTEITERSGRRFRNGDWHGIRNDAVERLELYSRMVDQSVSELIGLIGDQRNDETQWEAVKAAFVESIQDRYHYQLAETFYNSVIRRVFSVIGVNPRIEFTVSDFKIPLIEEKPCPICSAYPAKPGKTDIYSAVDGILTGFEKNLPLMDRPGDCRRVTRAIENHLEKKNLPATDIQIEMADPVFYRYKGAYLLGRILAESEIC
ncbi:MAG: isocitrate dehydrogenase kinase/phosphatase AceK regulatory subunit, partial [Thermodesulfobacteriota bacterium]